VHWAPISNLHAAVLAPHVQPQLAQPPSRSVGALGDSFTDEYEFYPPDRSRARNWVEILSATHRLNFGRFSTISRGEPRDQGFAFNWARSDATSSDLIQNQLPGLAAQVARGQVRYAWIFTGGNDFLFFLRDAQLSTATPMPELLASLAQVEQRAEANFSTAVNVLLASSPKVRLVVATVPDVALLPVVVQGANSTQSRAIVAATSQAIETYNAHIRGIAAGSNRIALVDLASESSLLLSLKSSSVAFGGITLDLTTPGDDYHHFFLADGIHIGTVGQGLIADAFLEAIDTHFNASIPLLSDHQIVNFARAVQQRH